MKCPYCKNVELVFRSGAKKTKRGDLRLVCPTCKELFLAKPESHSHPFQTHPKNKRLGVLDVTRVFSIRLSKRDIGNIEKGICVLTIVNNRLQLQYKT